MILYRPIMTALVIFSVPVCLARDGHVRVEVISERLPPGYRRGADIVALVLFLYYRSLRQIFFISATVLFGL